jgi:hypothetical protein
MMLYRVAEGEVELKPKPEDVTPRDCFSGLEATISCPPSPSEEGQVDGQMALLEVAVAKPRERSGLTQRVGIGFMTALAKVAKANAGFRVSPTVQV